MFGTNNLQLLLAEKDIRLGEKDRQLRMTMVIATVVVTLVVVIVIVAALMIVWEKDMLVAEKERQLVKAQAEAAATRARFQAEWNLRPVLETHVTRWLLAKGCAVPNGGQQKLDAFRMHGHPDRRHFDEHLDDAMKKNSVDPTKKHDVTTEMNTLFHTLSKRHHIGDAPDGVKGFVINHDPVFSAVVSAFLMSLGLPHTVLHEDSDGGLAVLYKWVKTEETVKTDTLQEASSSGAEIFGGGGALDY